MDNSTKVSVDIGATNGASSVIQAAMSEFGGLWKKIAEGGPAAVIGVAAVAGVAVGIGSAIKQAADFNQQVIRLQTSAGELPGNLKLVNDGMLQIARDTGTATQQLTSGMYQVESAGYHGAEAIKILAAASQGAKIEQADLAKVTDAVTSAMRDYNIPVSGAATLTSQMIAAVGAGKSTFETFTGSLHSVLPIASSLHVPLTDIMGDLASMTVHGMSADQATQDLAHTLGKFSGGVTAGMTSELAQLGIKSSDLVNVLGKQGPGGGLSGVVNEISDAITNHLGPSGTVMLNAFNGNKIMAEDAIKMMAAMSPQLQSIAEGYKNGSITVKEYRNDIKALPTDQANLLQQFVALNNKASGFSDILKSGKNATQNYTQALKASTGDATTFATALMIGGQNADYTKGAINAVSKAHADAKGNVKDWAEVQGELNIKLSQLKEIGQTAAISIGTKLLPAATSFLGVVIDSANWLGRHHKAIEDIIGIIGPLVAAVLIVKGAIDAWKLAVNLLKVAQVAFMAVMDMNPVILAIMAVVAVALLVITHWNTVKQWFKDFWGWLKNLWNGAGTFLYNVGKDMIQGLINGVTDMMGPAGSALTHIGNSLVNGIKSILGIHSPSTVFAEIGQNMGQGLIQGLQGIQAKANVAVTGLVTGSSLVNSSGSPSSNSVSTSTSHSVNNANSNVSIGQLIIQAPNGATLQSIIASINQDGLNTSRGLTPNGGMA